MSRLLYNGVVIDQVVLHDWTREPVSTATGYQYTRHTLTVSGVYSPKLNAYIQTPPLAPVAVLPALSNVKGLTTDLAIRHALEEPRKLLTYYVDGNVVLVSPPITKLRGRSGDIKVREPCDANHGPYVTVHRITEVHGNKTYRVVLSVTTYLTECEQFVSGQTPLILQHSWGMSESLDEDAFAVRTISGRVLFDAGQLLANGFLADDYREWMLHVVPKSFKRMRVQCFQHENPNEYSYQITDKEVAFPVVYPGVSRIEATYRQVLKTVGKEEIIKKAAPFFNLGEAIAFPWKYLGHVNNLPETVLSVVPRLYHQLNLRLWGYNYVSRQYLQDIGYFIIDTRISPLIQKVGARTIEVTHDLMGRYVQLSVMVVSGPIANLVYKGLSLLNGTPLINMGPDEIAATVAGGTSQVTKQGAFSTMLYHPEGARPKNANALVAQQVAAACALPDGGAFLTGVTNRDPSAR